MESELRRMREGEERSGFEEERHWKLEKVENVYIERGGMLRSCPLKTTNRRVFRTPLKLLHSLEIRLAKPAEWWWEDIQYFVEKAEHDEGVE